LLRRKKGRQCAFIDAEHALDPRYAQMLGVDIDNLLISQPDTGEQALEITDALVRSGAVGVLLTLSLRWSQKLNSRVKLAIHKWVFRPA
jgi:recombination protein RecA